MAFTENQSQQNRRLRTWPFRRRRSVINGNVNSKIDCKITYDSESDLRSRESLKSIFVTNSSKTIQVSEQNISQNSTTISMNTG